MNLLARLPGWARLLLLTVNFLAAIGLLAAYWLQTFPNLIASWVIAAAVTALLMPATAWVTRRLDERQEQFARRAAEHTATHLAAHHQALTEAVERKLAEHHAAISRELAAYHDRPGRMTEAGGA